jgi:hypothetical protein
VTKVENKIHLGREEKEKLWELWKDGEKELEARENIEKTYRWNGLENALLVGWLVDHLGTWALSSKLESSEHTYRKDLIENLNRVYTS